MNCLYYDEGKKQCTNPYSFYKGMDCPVKACQTICALYNSEINKTERIVQDLRYCAERDGGCECCSMNGEVRCSDSLMEMAADELERMTTRDDAGKSI